MRLVKTATFAALAAFSHASAQDASNEREIDDGDGSNTSNQYDYLAPSGSDFGMNAMHGFQAADPLPLEQLTRLQLVKAVRKRDSQPIVDGNRLTYLYGAGHPSLVCAPLHVCTLALEPGERIVQNGILLGDATRWIVVQIHVGANDAMHLAFKPVEANLRTSLSILTEARHYHIELLSHPVEYMPLVAFRYESSSLSRINEMADAALGRDAPANELGGAELPSDYANVRLSDLNFNYRISRCDSCPFRPERVFDDGVRTIIELPKRATRSPLPALLIVGAESNAQIANYRFIDDAFHVDQLFDEARLVVGVGRQRKEVRIAREL